MKIVFIAGPYTGEGTFESIEKNIREAEKYQTALANQQVGFFCAHNHTEHFSSKKGATPPEQFYYDLDFVFLKKATDAVLAMPGWKDSWGAKKEVEWAKTSGLKVFYPDSPKDIDEIVVWAHSGETQE